jgi:hypothetical protein
VSRVRLSLSHRAIEDSPSCLLRLRLALFSNWTMLFMGEFFVFSFFGTFLLLPLFLFVRLPSAAWLPLPPWSR